MTPAPLVSVVIPTYRRETRLAFALEALAAQTLPRDRYEVIVVRAEAPGGKTEAPPGLPVRFYEAPADTSAAQKRNIGWRAASAALVALTDDDCRPAPDWLQRLVDASGVQSASGGDFVLQGRTEPDPAERALLHGLARSQVIDEPSRWYQTCNIAYPYELIERLDGFDERFGGGGEDTDLGLRAVKAGARLVYVDEARVWHAVHSRHLWQALRDTRRWHTVPLVFARHPEQRDMLTLGIFWRVRHLRVLGVVGGVALFLRGRPGLAAVAMAPYVRHHRGGYGEGPRGLARAAADLPGTALVDAAEVVATVRAAVRHRVPLI